MQLKLIPTVGDPTPAYVSVSDGRLAVDCADAALCDELIDSLANRYFVQGQGFPVFAKHPGGEFQRQNGRLSLAGYVDLAAPESELLAAIGDNFRIGEQFRVSLEA